MSHKDAVPVSSGHVQRLVVRELRDVSHALDGGTVGRVGAVDDVLGRREQAVEVCLLYRQPEGEQLTVYNRELETGLKVRGPAVVCHSIVERHLYAHERTTIVVLQTDHARRGYQQHSRVCRVNRGRDAGYRPPAASGRTARHSRYHRASAPRDRLT
jgi:hypothetical protein